MQKRPPKDETTLTSAEFDRVVQYPKPTIDGFYVANFSGVYQFVLMLGSYTPDTLVDIMMRDDQNIRERESAFLTRLDEKKAVTLEGLKKQGLQLAHFPSKLYSNVECDAYLTPEYVHFYISDGDHLAVNNHFFSADKASNQKFIAELQSMTRPEDWMEFKTKGGTVYLNTQQDIAAINAVGDQLTLSFKQHKFALPSKIVFETPQAAALKTSIEEKVTAPAPSLPQPDEWAPR